MAREFIAIRGRHFTGRRQRELSCKALLIYQQLHFQPDLTPIGSILVNRDWLAATAKDLDRADIDRALDELEKSDLILTDSYTQELVICGFWDAGPVARNPNHLRGAARSFRAIESERLRAAIYEASSGGLKDAIDKAFQGQAIAITDPIEIPSEDHRDGASIYENENENENEDTRAVVKTLGQLYGDIPDDPDEIRNRDRVEGALLLLAQRRVAEAPGTRNLEGSASDQWARYGELLRRLVRDYPNWEPKHLANAIDHGTFSG